MFQTCQGLALVAKQLRAAVRKHAAVHKLDCHLLAMCLIGTESTI
jgi:hypothetical protein